MRGGGALVIGLRASQSILSCLLYRTEIFYQEVRWKQGVQDEVKQTPANAEKSREVFAENQVRK
jgi:hypothetical protein